MKKLLRILAYIVSTFVLLAVVFYAFVQWKSHHKPSFEVTELPIHALADSAVVAQGAKIVTSLCAGCHIGNDGALSGSIFLDPKEGLGAIWAANITRHPEKGIGRYSDGELAYTIRSGINRNGRYLGPFMQHPYMSDEELTAIVSFLRSDTRMTQASEVVHPATEYGFLFNALIALGFMDPIPVSTEPIHLPAATDTLAYGKHLAITRYTCANCHSASFETNNLLDMEKSPGYMAGGNPIENREHTEKTLSANITPDKATGIGTWTFEQFEQAVRNGKKPDETGLNATMPRFTLMDDAEIKAIWKYLQTIPAIDHPLGSKTPSDKIKQK